VPHIGQRFESTKFNQSHCNVSFQGIGSSSITMTTPFERGLDQNQTWMACKDVLQRRSFGGDQLGRQVRICLKQDRQTFVQRSKNSVIKCHESVSFKSRAFRGMQRSKRGPPLWDPPTLLVRCEDTNFQLNQPPMSEVDLHLGSCQ